jgi:glutathione S-transferase
MPRSSSAERILVTIPISHFCEKARWALDRAGVAYTEKRHVQLVHALAAKRTAGGLTAPALRTPEGTFSESAAILAYADEQLPEHDRLYPADAALRAEVDALQERFDTVLGPEGRRWLYHEVFKDARHFAPWNLAGVPAWERRAFPLVLPAAKVVLRRRLDISERTAARAAVRVDEELDFVAGLLSDGRRFLAGGRFTAADLAFAALAAPCVVPPVYGTPLPQLADMHAEMAAAVARWRAHPAGRFALRMYDEQRPAPKVTSL